MARLIVCLFAATLIIASFSSAFADSTESYVCIYPYYSDAKGKHKAESHFQLTFLIDRPAGKAYTLGNNGSNSVVHIENSGQISFIETTPTGNIISTTITSKMESVHSRNVVVFDDLIASQYYGTCKKK